MTVFSPILPSATPKKKISALASVRYGLSHVKRNIIINLIKTLSKKVQRKRFMSTLSSISFPTLEKYT